MLDKENKFTLRGSPDMENLKLTSIAKIRLSGVNFCFHYCPANAVVTATPWNGMRLPEDWWCNRGNDFSIF